MWWQEETKTTSTVMASTVVDVRYDMNCPSLPVDHAYALSQAIQQALPWFAQEPQAGLHLIHGRESGHGWQRPNTPDSVLYLSRRTKLILRLPQHRITDAQTLTGLTLDIANYPLQVGTAKTKVLKPMPVLFSRHVLANREEEEEIFLQGIVVQLQQLNIPSRKILCGKTSQLRIPKGEIFTRSLMVAALTPAESLTLQQHGLGNSKIMGCGLFVPQKDIKSVRQGSETE